MLALMLFCVFFQVLCRYVFHLPSAWTEELGRYLMICLAFFGSVPAFHTGDHLGAFFLRDSLKGRFKGIVLAIGNLVMIVFSVCMIYGAFKMIPLAAATRSPSMQFLHLSTLYVCFVIGFSLSLLYILRDMILSVKLIIDGDDSNLLNGKSSPFAKEAD